MDEVNKLGKILIVDDNEDVLFALNLLLEPYTEKIKVATTPDRIEHFMTTFQPDLILLDMNFSRDAISGQEGFESLKQILQIDPQAIVIFMTAYADTDKAVRAIKAGATDFIPKPWEKEKLLATLTSGMRLRQSQREVNILKEQVEALSGQSSPEGDIIGESPIMQEVFATINKLSSTDANILILGENGTGKDVIAEQVNALCKFRKVTEAIGVTGSIFNNKEIYSIIIDNISFNPIQGNSSVVPFTIEATSDNPYELTL